MSSGCRLGVVGWGAPAVTWPPGWPIRSAPAGEGGAMLGSSPPGLGWSGVLQCVGLCGLASAGGNSSPGLHSGARGDRPGFSGPGAGSMCGPLGTVGVLPGAGLPAVGVCGLSCVGGGGGCPAGGSVAGVCCCLNEWGRPVSQGPGLRVLGGKRGERGKGGDCAGGGVVSVYVSACSGALVWSVVGRAVWRRSLPSSAAGASILQTSMRIWCTSWSVVGRGYASSGLRPRRRRILWMAWYPQVRECWGLGGVLLGVWACLDLCVGVGDGPNPGHGRRGWPAALNPFGPAEHGQCQVVARLPLGDLGQGAGQGFVPRPGDAPEDSLRGGGVPYCPWSGSPGASMVSVPLTSHCGAGDVAVAATT